MSATDELRRLLDERGAEWRSGLEGVTFVSDWCFVEYDNGKLAATCEHVLTPEQAIAATLGRGTCRIEERYIDWYCDACFEMVGTCDTTSELFIDGNAIKLWNYCPNCGARVVEQ